MIFEIVILYDWINCLLFVTGIIPLFLAEIANDQFFFSENLHDIPFSSRGHLSIWYSFGGEDIGQLYRRFKVFELKIYDFQTKEVQMEEYHEEKKKFQSQIIERRKITKTIDVEVNRQILQEEKFKENPNPYDL